MNLDNTKLLSSLAKQSVARSSKRLLVLLCVESEKLTKAILGPEDVSISSFSI